MTPAGTFPPSSTSVLRFELFDVFNLSSTVQTDFGVESWGY